MGQAALLLAVSIFALVHAAPTREAYEEALALSEERVASRESSVQRQRLSGAAAP